MLHVYMQRLTKLPEGEISSLLPEQFAIVFNGWSAGAKHFVGTFAIFPSDCALGYEKFLLAMSSMTDEASHNASEHY